MRLALDDEHPFGRRKQLEEPLRRMTYFSTLLRFMDAFVKGYSTGSRGILVRWMDGWMAMYNDCLRLDPDPVPPV